MKAISFYIILVVAVSLIILPGMPTNDSLTLAISFFGLLFLIYFLSRWIHNPWIAYPLTFALVLIVTYLLNTHTSVQIPYTIIVITGLVHPLLHYRRLRRN